MSRHASHSVQSTHRRANIINWACQVRHRYFKNTVISLRNNCGAQLCSIMKGEQVNKTSTYICQITAIKKISLVTLKRHLVFQLNFKCMSCELYFPNVQFALLLPHLWYLWLENRYVPVVHFNFSFSLYASFIMGSVQSSVDSQWVLLPFMLLASM